MADRARSRSIVRRIAVSIGTLLVALLALEGGLRVAAHRRSERAVFAAHTEPALPPGARVLLADLVRPSSNPRIVYELRPGLDRVLYKHERVSTCSRGFRGPELAPAGPDTVTIVALGDSILFGDGIADGEVYTELLRGELERRWPGRTWRVANTGVPGYNTEQEIEVLRKRGLDLEPDIVLLHLCTNDLGLPLYMRPSEDASELGRSFVVDWVRARLSGAESREPGAPPLAYVTKRTVRELVGEGDRDRFTSERAEVFLGALDDLQDLAREHGFEVAVLAGYDWLGRFDWMLAAVAARDFSIIDLRGRLREELEAEGLDPDSPRDYQRSRLTVGAKNSHPSALQHRMIAGEVLAHLASRGLLDAPTSISAR